MLEAGVGQEDLRQEDFGREGDGAALARGTANAHGASTRFLNKDLLPIFLPSSSMRD
jgi:hypothetical protein